MEDYVTKKSLGQHWLRDKSVLSAIAEHAEIEQGDSVVEVGPGLGTLTAELLFTGARVTAVEFDEELFRSLEQHKTKLFGDASDKLTLLNQDILSFRFDHQPTDYKIVANIPYYLTSKLIRIISETENRPSVAVLLIQKEVAQRLCAKEGNMSLLSVWAQMYFECTLGLVVPAQLFTPPPKVDSQVVVMKRRSMPVFGTIDKAIMSRIIKAGFSNKRKTLHNSLSAGLQMSKDNSAALLAGAGLDASARPQELGLEDWVSLVRCYQNLTGSDS